MKLLSVAACIFLLTTAACGDKAPAKKDGDNAPAMKDSPTPVQDAPTDEVMSSEEDKAEDEMVSENELEDEMEFDDEVEDDTDNEDETETAVQGDDQEFDDDVKTIGEDEVNDAKPGLFSRWARRRRQKCVYHKGFHCKLAKLHGKSCKVCYDPE